MPLMLAGMIGVPGIAHRLFGALKNANISVMYIAQASSEYSICVATRTTHADRAKEAVAEVGSCISNNSTNFIEGL